MEIKSKSQYRRINVQKGLPVDYNPCRDCSCLGCNINGNPIKSCLPTKVLEIINGCMTCYLCINNDYNDFNNSKDCQQ